MAGLKFGWKKKAPSIQGQSALPYTNSAENNLQTEDEKIAAEGDWRSLLKDRKSKKLENNDEKFQRLYDEGSSLAEEERFWEAINRWNEALELDPKSEKIHEMKSQVLMELEEIFPAVESAQRAIHLRPNWAQGHQTLGRSLLNTGHLNLALKSFMTAEFLQPESPELWADDVKWTVTLIEQEKCMMSMDTT